jgi:hypothetical protein
VPGGDHRLVAEGDQVGQADIDHRGEVECTQCPAERPGRNPGDLPAEGMRRKLGGAGLEVVASAGTMRK